MPATTTDRPSVRERLLAAADELFYAEGVHTVGIDRVIERAGVSKASLYTNFGSKDELLRAYLEERHARWRERMTEALATRYDNPRDRLLGTYDVLGEMLIETSFRGCAFANATAEVPTGAPVIEAADNARAWRRELYVGLASDAGAPDPATLARQLGLLYDGVQLTARMDRDPDAAIIAKAAAAVLVSAALGD